MKNLMFIALIAAVFVSAVYTVITRHETRRLFVELQELEQMRDELNEEWVRLQLEQSTWATDSRIEKIATEKLHMRNVTYENTVIIKL